MDIAKCYKVDSFHWGSVNFYQLLELLSPEVWGGSWQTAILFLLGCPHSGPLLEAPFVLKPHYFHSRLDGMTFLQCLGIHPFSKLWLGTWMLGAMVVN